MPKTLTVDDAEIPTLQRLLQKGNADLPTLPGLATLTALSDPDPLAPTMLPPAPNATAAVVDAMLPKSGTSAK